MKNLDFIKKYLSGASIRTDFRYLKDLYDVQCLVLSPTDFHKLWNHELPLMDKEIRSVEDTLLNESVINALGMIGIMDDTNEHRYAIVVGREKKKYRDLGALVFENGLEFELPYRDIISLDSYEKISKKYIG